LGLNLRFGFINTAAEVYLLAYVLAQSHLVLIPQAKY
jgi:hypothetical protein